MGSVSQGFEILRSHICSTHVHDNDKNKDSHLWPGQGTIDWKEAMELLRSAPQTPPLLLEVGGRRESESAGEAGRNVREAGSSIVAAPFRRCLAERLDRRLRRSK